MPISRARSIFLALWVIVPVPAPAAHAQGTNGDDEAGQAWQLDRLHQGFCVQLLVEPEAIARRLPRGARALPAARIDSLHPALEGLVAAQPEFAAWAPSRLCLYYFTDIEAYGRRVSEENPRKAPLIGFWTVAAEDSATGSRRDIALEIVTSRSWLERWARNGGLDLQRVRSSVGPIPRDEEEMQQVPLGDRYQIRIGKALITWDGRPAADTTPLAGPAASSWSVEDRRGKWVDGTFTLSGGRVGSMIGSLKVEGKGDLASVLKRSPLRFVGPGYRGSAARVEFSP